MGAWTAGNRLNGHALGASLYHMGPHVGFCTQFSAVYKPESGQPGSPAVRHDPFPNTPQKDPQRNRNQHTKDACLR